jgi:peptidoglycan hydrolase-like protein with peptidoglycan-binding domain
LDGALVKVDKTQPAVVERPYLVMGSKGDAVTELQKLLKITVDGEFGPKTKRAVIEYQKSKKITADGKVGPQTWSKLKP